MFRSFPEIMFRYAMFWNHDLRNKTEMLVNLLLLFSIIAIYMMRLLVILFIKKLFAQIYVFKNYSYFSSRRTVF